jgi:phage baseplate assembly protein W
MSREYLGTGWKFPLQVDPAGRLATSSREQRIEESIYLILGTAKGERVMRPDFGCGLQDLVFAPDNAITRTRVAETVREALVRFEPRIDLLGVSAESGTDQPNLLLIRIDYLVRSTNTRGNMVYPFYLQEGG